MLASRYMVLEKGQNTCVSSKRVAVEFFGENHRCPTEVSAIFMYGLTKGELTS